MTDFNIVYETQSPAFYKFEQIKINMENMRHGFIFYKILFCLFILSSCGHSPEQPVVGLDNWFNRETKAETGELFHYLWTDEEWSGYSRWGEIFESSGAHIITVDRPSWKVLNKLDVYIIVDPDSTSESGSPDYILADDIKVIRKWVRKGGVMAVLANDGPNCEFTHLNNLMETFGMRFNHVTLHPVTGSDYEMGASTDLPGHTLFRGVSKIYMKEISDITLSGRAEPVLTENGRVLMAETKYGKGYVFAVGDPWIYNEYIEHDLLPESFQNRRAAENLTQMLLEKTGKK